MPATAEVQYRRGDRSTFAVRFDDRADTAVVTIEGRTALLRGRRPASGIWDAEQGHVPRGKGDAAPFDRSCDTAGDCRAG